MMQKWKYHWEYRRGLKKAEGISTTLREMTPHEFLSALAHWGNADQHYRYRPVVDQWGIKSQHECANIRENY